MTTPFAAPSGNGAKELAQSWADAVGAASRNLLDFRSCEAAEATRARLRPGHPRPLSGLSREKANQAHLEIDSLLQDHLPLSRVVEQARQLASKSGMFSNRDKEAIELLSGASVRLDEPTELAPHARDLAQGALPAEWATPAQALEAMRERFALARDAIVSVHEASLQAQALGLSPEQQADPLAALAAARELEAQRASLDAEREAFAVKSQAARAGIMALRAALARGSMAVDQAQSKILGYQAPRPPRAVDAVDFFEQWRSRVFEAHQERPAAASIGLGKLLEALAQARDKAEEDLQANRAPLEALESHKAAFEAHRAKAKALRERGADLGESLARLETATREAIKQTPADLALIGKLCPAYCAAVAALGA